MAKMYPFEKFVVNSWLTRCFHRWFGFGQFLKKLPANSFSMILEIGAGVGFTTELIAGKYPGVRIAATDFDEESIALAKRRSKLPNVTFQQVDATKLPFPDASFDAVFSVLTLHHISNFQTAIAELSRVTKPGGIIYIMDIPTTSFNFFHFRRKFVPGLFSKKDLMNLLSNCGLSVKDHGGQYLFYLEGKKK